MKRTAAGTYSIVTDNSSNWNTAYGWGNHASAGYLTSLPSHNHDDRYYTETEVNSFLGGKAPLTGTGASGTWGISITGNAATATNSTQLGGRSADSYYNFYNLTGFSVGGSLTEWYPIEFSGDYWGAGPIELELLRTSVHQDGSSYGYMHTKVFGHATAWGHHTDFWEWETNISTGVYAGFFNGASGNPCSNSFVVYLRGGLTYYHKSNAGTTAYIVQNTASAINISPCNNAFGVKTTLESNVANNSKYFQTDLNPKGNNGANLGSTTNRWNAVYAQTGYFYGDVIAYYSSDERLKKNVAAIPNAIEKIKQIGGYYFDWIEDETIHTNTGHDVGVIAQEIEQILPEVVAIRENGYKAVKYEKLTALLIQAVKEQQATIETLQKRVEDLENR
jgi:hypothetical protein